MAIKIFKNWVNKLLRKLLTFGEMNFLFPFGISLICIASPCWSQQNKFLINNDSIIADLILERNIDFRNVKNAKLVINQNYGEAGKIALPFEKDIELYLNYAGIKIDSIDYNLIVRINIEGVALSSRYTSYNNSKNEYKIYSGAQLKGSFEFEVVNGSKKSSPFYVVVPCSNETSNFATKPSSAPFYETYWKMLPDYMDFICSTLGKSPLIASLIIDEKYNNYLHYENIIPKLNSLFPEWRKSATSGILVKMLINILNDKNSKDHCVAICLLKEIKDIRAFPSMILALSYSEARRGNTCSPNLVADALNELDANWRN